MELTVAQQKYSRLAYTESVDEVDAKKETLLAKVEAMLVQKIKQSIDSTNGSSVKTTPFRSSKLILKIPENVRQIYSILSKEVTSFILYTLRFLQKKLPFDWPRQSFCC